MKPIHYSDHARARLRKRQITRQQVRWLIARGVREPAFTNLGAQRWRVRGYLGRHEAAVIFVETNDRVVVVTVMWVGKERE